jgi:hypothetical protein
MSILTEALEELENWLSDNYPDKAASLPPGLTPEEIDSLAENLSFELPTEIRELYEWHDGSGNFGILLSNHTMDERPGFLSLEKAVDNSEVDEAGHITQRLGIDGFHLFPEFERWVHFSVCKNSEESPIWIVTDDPYIRLGYTSITSMILTTLECYQTGILEIGNYLYDEEEFLEVWNQNNNLISFFEDETFLKIVY